MSPVVAYQFLPARKPAVIRRLLAQLPTEHVVAILDLEDSAGDVIAGERTDNLKAAARANLVAFLSTKPAVRSRLAVRVNGSGSPHHEADLEAIADLRRAGCDMALVLPKVESAAQVEATADFFLSRRLTPPRFLILAETGAGVAGLSGILQQTRALIDGVVLGMIDYALDQNLWPFPGPLDAELWRIAGSVAGAAAKIGAVYVHTPCLCLHDAPLVRRIRRRISETFSGRTGMVSLSLAQTRAIVFAGGDEATETPERACDPVTEARDVVRRFLEHHHAKRSFTVDAALGRYIPPHEYLAAIRFLEQQGLAP